MAYMSIYKSESSRRPVAWGYGDTQKQASRRSAAMLQDYIKRNPVAKGRIYIEQLTKIER